MSTSAIDDVIRIDVRHGFIRSVIGIAMGIAITFLLYWLMSALVAAGRNALTEAPKGRIVDFVRVPNPPQLRTEQPKPEKPPKPQKAPETPQMQNETVKPSGNTVNIGSMAIDSDLAVDTSAGLSASDGEYLPIVKVAPVYPRRAQSRGIEGWVLLSFTVTETGSVIDPVVIDAEPQGLLPEWMRFVKGVVDSEDLPLNISRESMQDSALVKKLNTLLTKRFIKHIAKGAKASPEKHEEFHERFSRFLKEGIATGFEHHEALAELLRFESSMTDEGKNCLLYTSPSPRD